ncbi:MAG: L,D-transpeptidase [Chloroflexota bacterium]
MVNHSGKSRWLLATLIILVNIVAWRTSVFAADCASSAHAAGCTYGLPTDQYQALAAVMAANPAPNGQGLTPDPKEVLRYSDTRKADYHIASSFTGVLINGLPPLQMAWVIKSVRPVLNPGGDPNPDAPRLQRYSRVYLYATVHYNGLDWVLVGPGQWVTRGVVARVMPPSRPAEVGGRWVSIDLSEQVLTAYEGDQAIFTTLVSTGKGTRPTRPGLFHIYLRQTVGDMSALMGTPDYYNIYNVPWVMYFSDGMALHAAPWHDNFGYVMSHGCVNMAITDARWLFGWTESAPSTWVYVWRSHR